MKRRLLKSIFEGISIDCMIFECIYSGTFSLTSYQFTKMVIGAMLVGFGFSIPSFIYENEKYSLLVQTLIHMRIGVIVMIIVGWIPLNYGLSTAIFMIVLEIAISILIWLIYCLQNKKLVKSMNERIHEIQSKK
ncbi:DUF3021 domain-containing protein [Sharpea azabuensis]|uniref:DUF3021 domain-containing protein n=1 Tax=Sharpea porci TaxID=2652286 RepID=A0A844FRW9_9FIRM|nr:DUF3021 domain-containing protein [Sharpea porci]MDD6712323.1 DUF3021 domain-containing protein [Sharpea porci]MST88688.1 DUF3021 domain-containing protein [Sharpea porci]